MAVVAHSSGTGKWWLALAVLLAVGAAALAAPPVAGDDSYTTAEDTVFSVPPPGVLGNDSDPDGDSITAVLATDVDHGSLTLNPDGSFIYIPAPDFYGTDQFTYRAFDGGSYSAPATVIITVLPVNDAPVAQDDTLAARAGVPLAITLVAQDEDIDPANPEAHPLSFAILEGPTHGSLVGDLSEVIYEAPHTALVTLVFTPEAGFTGEDRVVFQVTDELGESDRGTVVFQVGEEEVSLSGKWEWRACWSGPSFTLDWLSSQFTGMYQRGAFSLTGRAQLTEDGLRWVRVEARWPAELFSIRTALKVSPTSTGTSSYWDTRLSFDLPGAAVSWVAHLASEESSSYHRLTVRGAIGEVMLRSTTRFSGWGFDFAGQELYARWAWERCNAQVSARLVLTKVGFDYLSLTARDIPLLGCGTQGITLELRLRFTTAGKELTPVFRWPNGWVDCLQLLCQLESADAVISGLHVYGFRLRCELPGELKLELATSLTRERNSALTGYADYFERWTLNGPFTHCCGEGEWEIATYFQAGTSSLFSWGMTKLRVELDYPPSLSLYSELRLREATPPWTWEGGIAISW